MTLSELLNKAQSIRINKSMNGSITISFSLLSEDYNYLSLSNEISIDFGIAGSLNFKLRNFSDNGVLVYCTYGHNPYEEMVINRTVKFVTISSKVKEFYDTYLMTEPFISSIEDADTIYLVKEVDSIYGISGWTVTEILDKIKEMLKISIDTITIPSAFNYHLSNFIIRRGTNLINTLQGLFPGFAFTVTKTGNTINIRNNIYNRNFPVINGIETCNENEYETTTFEIDDLFISGDISKPEYIEGVDGNILNISFRLDDYIIEEKNMLNLIGRNYSNVEISTKKTIIIGNYGRYVPLDLQNDLVSYSPTGQLPEGIKQLADGTYTNL